MALIRPAQEKEAEAPTCFCPQPGAPAPGAPPSGGVASRGRAGSCAALLPQPPAPSPFERTCQTLTVSRLRTYHNYLICFVCQIAATMYQ